MVVEAKQVSSESLVRTAEQLSAGIDLGDALELLAAATVEAIGADLAIVRVFDAATGTWSPGRSRPRSPRALPSCPARAFFPTRSDRGRCVAGIRRQQGRGRDRGDPDCRGVRRSRPGARRARCCPARNRAGGRSSLPTSSDRRSPAMTPASPRSSGTVGCLPPVPSSSRPLGRPCGPPRTRPGREPP